MSYKRTTPWTRQPQYPVGIDLNNRYGASLITGLNGGYGPTTSAKGSQLTTTAGAGRSPGLVTYSGEAGNSSDYGLLQPTNAFAIVARIRKPTAHALNSSIFDNKKVANWGAAPGFELNIRGDQGMLFVVGTAEVYTDAGSFGDAAFHTVTAIFIPGTQQDFYIDGVKPTYTASAIASSYTASSLNLISGSYYDLTAARSGASEIGYAYLLNGVFTLAELNLLHANPWQIFAPIRRKIWVAGAGVILASTTQAGAWSVRNLAAQTQASAFSVRNLVGATQASAWSVRNLASQTQAGAWTVRNLAATTQAGAWSVAATGIASSTQAGSWSVRNLVSTSRAGAFSVRNLSAQTQAGAWSVRSSVSTTKAGGWTVYNSATSTQAGAWKVWGYAAGTQAGSWSVGGSTITMPAPRTEYRNTQTETRNNIQTATRSNAQTARRPRA